MQQEGKRNRNAERFKTLATIRFSEAGPRELVVSVSKGRIILGQKIIFKLDGGGFGHVFVRNQPSLDIDQAQELIDALNKGIQDLMGREADISMNRYIDEKGDNEND